MTDDETKAKISRATEKLAAEMAQNWRDNDKPSAKNLENVEHVGFWKNRKFESAPAMPITVELLNKMVNDIKNMKDDPGYCGLGIETGKHDPWWKRVCQPHDAHYNALKAGKPDTSNVKAQAEFATGILKGMAEGAWMLISGPFYLLFGSIIGGTLRYTQLERRAAKARGEEYPSNSPED